MAEGRRQARTPRARVVVVALLVLALVCRLGVVAATPSFKLPPRGFDPPAYDSFGAAIARTGSFPEPGHRPTALYPPGYPYFLGAVYAVTGTGAPGRVEAGRIAGALLGTL